MNTIDSLISKQCPNGVMHYSLSEAGNIVSGLRGKSKRDFSDGNSPYVSYVNIFNNPGLDIDVFSLVKVAPGERQNEIRLGDVLMTGSSETRNECGMTSVVTTIPKVTTYINSFCFIWRPKEEIELVPNYSKHLFRSRIFRDQVIETTNVVTRHNISKPKLIKIKIPIPPKIVQIEIAGILDRFNSLEAELEAELEARRQQYQYYRDKLLTFEGVVD
jgi:type I restriction enzyme S subunit